MDDKNMEKLLKDVLKQEANKIKRLFAIFYIVLGLLLASIIGNCYLLYTLSQYQLVETIEETYDYEVEGDGNNLVNGNQYNDNAIHNEGMEGEWWAI